MKDRFIGLALATIFIVCGAWLYDLGYRNGIEDESKRMATELVRRRLAFWQVNKGEASLVYRIVPQVHQTCVKYGNGGEE